MKMIRKHRLMWAVMLFLTIVFVAITGYMVLLDLRLIDALYMTAITLSTVGFGEVAEMTDAAKVFSIGVIISGIGTVGFMVSSLVDTISAGKLYEARRQRKMKEQIAKLEQHYIVCGAGETGRFVIRELKARSAAFVVIENDPKVIESLDCLVIEGDATREESLLEAGVKKAQGLVTTLSKDADNVYTVLTAREHNANMVILARSHDEYSYKKLKRAGANNTVSPNEIGGKKLASMLLRPSIAHFMDHVIDTANISLEMEEIDIHPNSHLCQTKLKDSRIAEVTGLVILALRKADSRETFIFNPKAQTLLEANDKMIVIGEKAQIEQLRTMSMPTLSV